MPVRAKFTCASKKEIVDGYVVSLNPVRSGSKENEEFYKYTPYGQIEIGTVNKVAAEQFRVGKDYYIDFIETGAT
jgi:hypothetical protein